MAFQDHHHQDNLSQEEALALHHYTSSQHHQNATEFHSSPDPTPPTWLNSSLLRHHHHQHHFDGSTTPTTTTTTTTTATTNFLHLQASNNNASDSSASTQWFTHSGRRNDDVAEAMNDNSNSNSHDWEREKWKVDILNHPLYDQMLAAHVACLRIATPVDQLPRIDSQLAHSHHVVAKYSAQQHHPQTPLDHKDLDHFMSHYVLLLSSFKEQLQQHVRVHAMEAVMSCWELEQSLQSLTGVAPGEGTGTTMSDDDDDPDSDSNFFDGSLDGPDSMGFGPLVPTESERSLMERVRQELKHELKQGYKEKLVDVREEILRKRRAGKLPGDTTSALKAWWQSHSKWPYPTEEDKVRLVQETGLQLKQINNWFINQRKRNWHSNPTSSSTQKSKRKSNAGEKTGSESFM